MIELYCCPVSDQAEEHQCARALLFWAARRKWPEIGEKPAVETQSNGKPIFRDFPQHHFNLSHSGGWAVCALSDYPVGIDLQKADDRSRAVSRKFTQEEQDWLAVHPTEEFYALWTKKEAYLKYTGAGLTRKLSSFSVLPVEENQPEAGVWNWALAFPCSPYYCAVCGQEEPDRQWNQPKGAIFP
jgi:4'-phosphopantetheinyl transferase